MIIVSGIIAVDPSDHDRVVAMARDVAAASLEEAGCHAYGFWAHPDQPGRFRVFEEWESAQALEDHFATPHFQAFGAALAGVTVTEMDVNRYVDPTVTGLFG